jgi:hypothetical protein
MGGSPDAVTGACPDQPQASWTCGEAGSALPASFPQGRQTKSCCWWQAEGLGGLLVHPISCLECGSVTQDQ